jgi:hypothetical protein
MPSIHSVAAFVHLPFPAHGIKDCDAPLYTVSPCKGILCVDLWRPTPLSDDARGDAVGPSELFLQLGQGMQPRYAGYRVRSSQDYSKNPWSMR